MTNQYNVNYFQDRKLKYEKNHGVFIHEFMFTEFSNRILGQCNVALNNLQRQLDLEIARAKAEEARLNEKIDSETTRATAEETHLNGKIDAEINRATERENELSTNINAYLPKAGGQMTDRGHIWWVNNRDNPNMGGLSWLRGTNYINMEGKITGNDNLNLVISMGANSNAIVFKNPEEHEVASIRSDGVYTGSIDWDHINNRPEDIINPDLNQIKNNINKVLKYTNLYYSNNYDINEIDDNNKIGYTSIMLTDNGNYDILIDSETPLKDILNTSFATIATALNQINKKLDALENK